MSTYGQRWPRSDMGAVAPAALPVGPAGGDLTGTYPNPTLIPVGTAGTYTKVTTDAEGRVESGTTLVAGDLPSHTHDIADITDLEARLDALEADAITHWEPVTNGNPSAPEVLFDDDGDIIMAEVAD